MAIFDDVKAALRISPDTSLFDGEIYDLIESAKAFLIQSNVNPSKVNDTDPLIKRAILTYCKAFFGYDNPDSEKLEHSFDSIRAMLGVAGDYHAI